MEQMTRRDQELQGLCELRRNLEALERRKKEYEEIRTQQEQTKLDVVDRAERRTQWLPVDHASKYTAERYKKHEKKWKLNNALIKMFLVSIILILGALMVWLAWRNEGGGPILFDVPTTFIAVFSIAAAIMSIFGIFLL